MITVGIADTMISKTNITEHLQDIYKGIGAKVEVVLQPGNGFYYKNKRVGFRRYQELLKENYTDILIVMLTKEGLLSDQYKKIPIDILVVTSDALEGAKGNNFKLYEHKIAQSIGEHSYAIIPAGFENKKKLINKANQLITYGMGRNAMVSASSLETNVEGYHLLQCCIQSGIETFQGKMIDEQEFALRVIQKDVDTALAGIATLLLYGVDCDNILDKYQG